MSWAQLSTAALLAFGSLVVYLTFPVWAAAFLGVLFAISLTGPADWIRSKWKMPAWTATLLTMLTVLTALTGLGFVIGPPIVQQADELASELPLAVEKSLDWLDDRQWGKTVVSKVESLSGMSAQPPDGKAKTKQGVARPNRDAAPRSSLAVAKSAETALESGNSDQNATGGETETTEDAAESTDDNGGGDENGDNSKAGDSGSSGNQFRTAVLAIVQTMGSMISLSASTIMLLLVSCVMTLYIALNPDVYRRGILWMIPSEHESLATLTMDRIGVALRWWILGRLASMVAVGLLTSLGMRLIGMPAPLALGALAGLLSFVPNIGPIVAAAPGLLLAIPDGPWMLLSALGVYIVTQIIESNLLSPLIDKYTVATPPAVLIFIQVIMGVMAGAWGAVIASPLLVVMLLLIQQLYARELLDKPIRPSGIHDVDVHHGMQSKRGTDDQ